MSKYIIQRSCPLRGEVKISGSKNAVLPIMAAALLSEEPCEIFDAPKLRDVDVMCRLLRSVGCSVSEDYESNTVQIAAKTIMVSEPDPDLARMMRASILLAGPLLARTGKAKLALPGGCAIGDRPIELHLKGFQALGAEIAVSHDFIELHADCLSGGKVYLDFPSVGATENIMMAAVLAEGQTIIENCAEEPEIVDLANYMNKMGAKVRGAGTDTIRIEGVPSLHSARHAVIPDRIETGTFMVAAVITRGSVLLKNVVPNHVKPAIAKLVECGAEIEVGEDTMLVRGDVNPLIATDIKTMPYPGFPTDMQPQFMALLSTVDGASTFVETIFENRYMHVGELNRMGANITTDSRKAVVPGGKQLSGAQLVSTDLRGGAAMVLAGLAAEGETEVSAIYHIERGYENFVTKLTGLGAHIRLAED